DFVNAAAKRLAVLAHHVKPEKRVSHYMRPRRNGAAHASAASLMHFCTMGSRESGELPSCFSLPDTKYRPDTCTSVGSAASRTYCCEPRSVPTAAKKGITWFIIM